VPQQRERIYIVGRRSKIAGKTNFDWPMGSNRIVGIGKFIKTGVTDHSISKHLQQVYIYKKDDGRPQIVDKNSNFPIKTLVASYHKIQRLTGTFVKDGETGLRLLTADECKAAMGFPKKFIIPVSRTQMYRQMGNSVAVPVIKALATWMVEDLKIIK
jgi:DNA (cytosine-5)-methyltransferase 1